VWRPPGWTLPPAFIDGAAGAGANRVDGAYLALAPETRIQIKDELVERA